MTTPALSITDLVFRYSGTEFTTPPILNIAALELAPGEQILLTGGSGTGKSTLLQLIAGLMEPSSGRITIAGTDVHSLHGGARDRFRGTKIGMIFQTFNLLLGFTARENVMAALLFSGHDHKDPQSHAGELLRTLGIERPDALVDRLSVGQQQRVAVARAIACSPAIVLADEPTASLDPDNAAKSMDLIQQACRSCNAALLCVSHDPAMVARFTRVESLTELSKPHAGAPR